MKQAKAVAIFRAKGTRRANSRVAPKPLLRSGGGFVGDTAREGAARLRDVIR